MKIDPAKSEELQNWLDKATSKGLDEKDYQALLESLPKDPEERKFWLDHLRLSESLIASAKKAKEGELQEILSKIPSNRAERSGGSWIKAVAMVAVSFGGLALALHLIPTEENYQSGDASYTVVTEIEKSVTDSQTIHRDASGPAPNNSVAPIDEISAVEMDQLIKEAPLEEIASLTETVYEREGADLATLGVVNGKKAEKVNSPAPTVFAEKSKKKDQLATTSSVTSNSGTVRYQVDDKEFNVKTPTAVAGVRGMEFKKSAKGLVASGRRARSQPIAAPKPPSGERYVAFDDHSFVSAQNDSKSTFSIDVDTASYANVRRMLRDGQLPNPDAVRIEEMINTFRYDYPTPRGEQPFSVNMDQTVAPWNPEHRVVRIGLQGRVDLERPPVNLVFLLDVSGSMNSSDKLPLLKRSFSMLLNSLGGEDTVSIVAYAGRTGVVLDPTPATDQQKILSAMDQLKASGSTNGAGGIQLAYDLAKESFIKDGVNRVVLATDGDFNVGISDRNKLISFIEEKRRTGVELSVLGFGRGNIRDDIMESLANKGNGNYSYIDSVREARKALVEELDSNLVTIAKDVKIQVEFNPNAVQSFRLIGYENRKLAHKDFADDTKDAGEIGMGHSVTALYEVVPSSELEGDEKLLTLNLRHKEPGGSVSKLQMTDLHWAPEPKEATTDLKWSLAVASWGQMLRKSEHVNNMTPENLLNLAREGRGQDTHGYRAEMIQLIETWVDLGGKDAKSKLPRWEYRK